MRKYGAVKLGRFEFQIAKPCPKILVINVPQVFETALSLEVPSHPIVNDEPDLQESLHCSSTILLQEDW